MIAKLVMWRREKKGWRMRKNKFIRGIHLGVHSVRGNKRYVISNKVRKS